MNFNRLFDARARREQWSYFVSGRVVLLLLAILCMPALTVGVSAQVLVTAISKDNQALKSTNEVKCTRYADSLDEDVSLGMALEAWDELTSLSGLVTIELTAPNGSKFKGFDNLRVILKPPQDKDLVLNVLSGSGEMQSAEPTEMTSGDIGLVIVKTEYAVRVHRTKDGPVQEVVVLEGEVKVLSPERRIFPWLRLRPGAARPGVASLAGGQKIVFDSGAFGPAAVRKIDAQDIAKSAAVYARIDTAKAMMRSKVDREKTYANLADRYTAVFSDPRNADKRIQLAVDQVNLDVNDDALYQLNKAEQFTAPDQSRTRATIALTKGAAFSQTGATDAAKREIQKARVLDASVLEENSLRNYRFNEKTHTEILQYKLISVPSVQGGAIRGSAWPIPRNLSSPQQQIFKLIREGRFEQAQKVVQQGHNRLGDKVSSIDAYAYAIISYELKDTKSASSAAGFALKQSSVDNLLTKDVYAATQKIFEATRQQ